MGRVYSLDKPATSRFCEEFVKVEGVAGKPYYDDPLSPTRMHIPLTDGFHQSGGFDVRWKHDVNYYHIHYREPFEAATPQIEYRFDRHNDTHSPQTHFHEPPDASPRVSSCITVTQVPLVARAVAKTWRYGYENNDVSLVNDLSDPP
jgi:hypothetical protein